MSLLQKALRRFSVKDLILIAAMAAAGIALKVVVNPMIKLASAPLMIPGGALGGGLYMLWLVLAAGITGKTGSATLAGFVQALLVILIGIGGSHGIFSLVSYTLPGLAIDLWLLISRHRVCCLMCAFISCMLSNLCGTALVNQIFFSMPLIPLLLSFTVAAFSGGFGGALSWYLLRALRKYEIVPSREDS